MNHMCGILYETDSLCKVACIIKRASFSDDSVAYLKCILIELGFVQGTVDFDLAFFSSACARVRAEDTYIGPEMTTCAYDQIIDAIDGIDRMPPILVVDVSPASKSAAPKCDGCKAKIEPGELRVVKRAREPSPHAVYGDMPLCTIKTKSYCLSSECVAKSGATGDVAILGTLCDDARSTARARVLDPTGPKPVDRYQTDRDKSKEANWGRIEIDDRAADRVRAWHSGSGHTTHAHGK